MRKPTIRPRLFTPADGHSVVSVIAGPENDAVVEVWQAEYARRAFHDKRLDWSLKYRTYCLPLNKSRGRR